MADLRATVLDLLGDRVRERRLRVAVLCRGAVPLASAVAAAGHRTVVVSDRFRPLLALQRRMGLAAGERIVLAEAGFRALPMRPRAFDALVLAHGLPRLAAPAAALRSLRELLVPGGLLIWVQPVTDGFRGKLALVSSPARRAIVAAGPRHELCRVAMAAGFGEIGQRAGRGRLLPLVVTSAIAAREPAATPPGFRGG